MLRPESRGYIRLRSPSALDPPVIQPNYLSSQRDVDILVEGEKFCRRLAETPTMRALNVTINPNKFPACRHLPLSSDEYMACQVGRV